MSATVCAVCARPAPLKCSSCQLASYCTKEHQKQHWKAHKSLCRAYEVQTSPELGRHLIASRDLGADDVILVESPLVAGPRHHDEPPAVCVGCLRALPPDLGADCRCARCLWPACAPDCPGLVDAHGHAAECRALQAGRHVVLKGDPDLRYDALLPLRCLLLQKTAPSKWKAIQSMKAHMNDRGPGSAMYGETQDRIVNYLRDNFLVPLSVAVSGLDAPVDSIAGLLEDSSAATLHRIVGVLDVNALEISAGRAELSALFPTAYLMEHSCTPNSRHTFDAIDGEGAVAADARLKITLRAAVKVSKGEHICTMYTHILWGTMARREHLHAVKGFWCVCPRCADPRELGSMLSALRCLACASKDLDSDSPGYMLPVDPLKDAADWRCDQCAALVAAEHVAEMVSSLDEQVGQALALQGQGGPGGQDAQVQVLEDVVGKLERLLHPMHYHCLQVKHYLLQMYGSQAQRGLGMDKLSAQQLERKAALSRSVLGQLLLLDPSMSRLQLYASVCLLELHRADLELLKRAHARTSTSSSASTAASGSSKAAPAAATATLQDLRSLLARAQHALRYESPDSDGARMATAVERARQELEVWARVNKLAG